MKKFLALSFALFSAAAVAGTTSNFLKNRAAKTVAVTTGKWHANFAKAKSYATSKKVPLIAVWSNGDACPHCTAFESACMKSAFTTWMKTSGCVFSFNYPGDGADGTAGSSASYRFCLGSQRYYPLVRVYWPSGKVDVKTMGDSITSGRSDSTGAKNAVKWFNSKLAKFSPKTTGTSTAGSTTTKSSSTATKKYTIKFDANGGEGAMASATAKVGTSKTLPANAFKKTDYSFAGWAKSPTGDVKYKNKASVKNLSTKNGATVTLYAKWTRTTYRTYYTGIKCTISLSGCKGYSKSSGSVSGMSWSKSTGKLSGTPKKAGTFTLKFKKGSTVKTRKVVVVKDELLFADEESAKTVTAAGRPIDIDLSPVSKAGEVKEGSVSVAGLPAGLAFSDGGISGASAQVGAFKITVSAVSAKGQKLTRTFVLDVGVPECCIGMFNGFIGDADPERLDPLALSNRGMFRLSAPSTASLSAKITTAKATYSLTATGWTKNGDGTYTAHLASASGKDVLAVTVGESGGTLDERFCAIGTFAPSYGTVYAVWAQRSPFGKDAAGAYVDPVVAYAMPKIAGKWYLKATATGPAWQFSYGTSKSYNAILSVSADGVATLAGTIGKYKASASSAVFVFDADVETGFARCDFAIPVTVSKTKKTLDVWLNLWFDKSNAHVNARGEGVGMATVEAFE